jgi:hypothetical protein
MTDRAEQRPLVEKVSLGPWTISASRAPAGTLSIEVLLGDVPHANIELDEGGMQAPQRSKAERGSKLKADMDF